MSKRLLLPVRLLALALMAALAFHPTSAATRLMENLDRGLVAVKVPQGVYVGWRIFGYENPAATAFNLYRNGTKLNAAPITASTNYLDASGTTGSSYTVRAVVNGVEQTDSKVASVWPNYFGGYSGQQGAGYWDIPLQVPAGGTTPDAVDYVYSANDCSVGDLDGDGDYEMIVKWDPSNAKDNAHSGYTGNVYLDAYQLDGTRLWRIDLGRNIRAGAHYTQFMVWDLDSDGRAEIACKTAPGTIDGQGNFVLMGSDSPTADYRNSSGYILSGPEYLTIFDGQTGAELATTAYNPPRGSVSAWGDNYGNRVDRFLACVAYVDGEQPSLVMCRGYYTRAVLAAWNWRDGQLTNIWTFDTNTSGNSGYRGQGNHQLSVHDVDADGRDEIIYGACVIDDDGTGLYTTGLGHGDALHAGDLDPTHPGLEIFTPHESGGYGDSFRDAATGQLIFRQTGSGDNGRGCVADLDPNHPGVECWSSNFSVLKSSTGATVSNSKPGFTNFVTWWDGELDREYSDGDRLDKYGRGRLISYYQSPGGAGDNNGTKSTPNLQADLFGDWREEMVLRGSNYLRIFTTTYVTNYRIHTLMHDPAYREAIAWQNVAYNQPPWPSFFLGYGMSFPVPLPDIAPVNGCRPEVVTPYLRVDAGDWRQTGEALIENGQTVEFGPQPVGGGQWNWTGPNGFTAATRVIELGNLQPWQAGEYVATFTSDCGAESPISLIVEFKRLITRFELESSTLDSSDEGNDGTTAGSPGFMAGQFGQAIDLDGTDDRITLPAGVANSTDITIAAWVNWDGGGNWQRIFDFGNGSSENLFLTPRSGSGTMRFAITQAGSGGEQRLETSALPTGQWVHLAVTLEDNTGKLWVNGELVDENAAMTINPRDFNPATNYIGDSQYAADPYFDGRIDDFRIYNYALPPAAIAALMSNSSRAGGWTVYE